MKHAALSRLALEPDVAAHHLHQPLADGEPEPGAAVSARDRRIGLAERPEEAIALLAGEADAAIGHGEAEADPITRSVERRHHHSHPAVLRELDRVPHEVGHDLPEPQGVSDEGIRQTRLPLHVERQRLLFGAGREEVGHDLQHLVERERERLHLQRAGLDLRVVEDCVEHAEERLGRRLNPPQVVALAGREVGVEHEVREADDGVHRCPDFVAHVRQELGLRAIRPLCLPRRLAQHALVALAIRHVPDEDHQDAAARLGVLRRDVHVNRRSVLAPVPRFEPLAPPLDDVVDVADRLLLGLGGLEVGYSHPEQLLPAVAHHSRVRGVGVEQPAVNDGRHPEAVHARLDNRPGTPPLRASARPRRGRPRAPPAGPSARTGGR